MPRIQANGIQLYYELHGPADADVLVLSNGILMSTASWPFQTPVLSKHYRLLLYDCRGQWQSDHPAEPYSMELHAEDLAALLDALHIRRAHIGGVSYGSEISLAFALGYPDRVQSLVISSAASELGPVLWGVIKAWAGAARAHDAELFYNVTYPYNFSRHWIAANPKMLAQARARYETLDFDAVVNLCQAFMKLNLTKDLHKITAPTLLMFGEEDVLKPRYYSDLILAEMPQTEFAILPKAGHALMWEQPDVFNSLVLGFLAKQHH
ncbi:MAG: alpha/beta hydrolase [Chloroflexi bacterium]|nr:alpha/beta hydrolase [Chloroflexota bacterium]